MVKNLHCRFCNKHITKTSDITILPDGGVICKTCDNHITEKYEYTWRDINLLSKDQKDSINRKHNYFVTENYIYDMNQMLGKLCPICMQYHTKRDIVPNYYNVCKRCYDKNQDVKNSVSSNVNAQSVSEPVYQWVKIRRENPFVVVSNNVAMFPVTSNKSDIDNPVPKVCDNCGRFYVAKQPGQENCGNCYNIKVCKNCNNEFLVESDDNREFCSYDCEQIHNFE